MEYIGKHYGGRPVYRAGTTLYYMVTKHKTADAANKANQRYGVDPAKVVKIDKWFGRFYLLPKSKYPKF